MRRARDWAVRCALEWQDHERSCWATLTYDEQHLPPTLEKRHLQLWLKRVRRVRSMRFFASGEYGERTERPHYHVIVYGHDDADLLRREWPYGHVRVDPLSPALIAYTAGYVAKKVGFRRCPEERVDPETGEWYVWQPPFLQMSRRPGIGGSARVHTASWRRTAIYQSREVSVPRFLHEAWKVRATLEELERLKKEKAQFFASRDADFMDEPRRLFAERALLAAKQHQANQRRSLQ